MYFRNLLLPMMAAASVLADTLPIRVVSFNIRYAATSRETNEKAWWSLLCLTNHDNCREYHLCSTLGECLTISHLPPTGP